MRRALLLLLTVASFACSSSSSSSPPSDAGADATIADSGGSGSSSGGFPGYDANVGGGIDAGSKCSDLRAQVQDKAVAAEDCDPSLTQQCTATTQGICCPISITFGRNPQAVDDLQAAISAYANAGCDAGCSKLPCGPAPSAKCDGTGHSGTCE